MLQVTGTEWIAIGTESFITVGVLQVELIDFCRDSSIYIHVRT